MFSFGEYGVVSLSLAAIWGVFWIWQAINRVIGKQGVWELPPVWARLLYSGSIVASIVVFAAPMWERYGLWAPGPVGIAAGFVATAIFLGTALYASTVLTRILSIPRPGRKYSPVVTVGPYAAIRHPMYVLTALAAWASAVTFGRPIALIAAFLITFFQIGLAMWEERSLTGQEGSPYPQYRARVPMLVPRPRFGKVPKPVAPSGPPVSSRTLFEKKQPHRAAPGGKG